MSMVANPQQDIFESPVSELKNKTKTDFVITANDGYAVELVSGSAVTDLLSDPWFQKSWDTLFESCPWATVFQSRPFVTACYQLYREHHLPIIVKAVEGGQLKGLLPMILLNTKTRDAHITRKGGRITGPGHYEAEFQTWLTAPSDGNVFIKKALAELMKQFPGNTITFRFIPSNAPLEWIKDDKHWRKCSIVQSFDLPVIHFNDPEPSKIFKRKHFKNKLNRLKRLGDVQFETISDYKDFESSLDEMALLYDFRQSAMFNKVPFIDDREKKDFLLELFRLKLLHTTVLKVNGETIAGVVAVKGKDNGIHLAGINCHSPFKARSYSPGFLHFILLSKQLSEERMQYFDLSPGYDAYKDELANHHEEVKELVITSDLKFHIKRKIKNWIHARLIAAGIRPMTAELNLKRYLYLVRHCSARAIMKSLAKKLGKKRNKKLYFIQTNALESGVKIPLHKNNLSDLMEFQPGKEMGFTKWEWMANAMYRLENGQYVFTCKEKDRLLCCVWLTFPDANSTEGNNNPETESAIVVESCYCDREGKDRLPALINTVATEVANKKESSLIYFKASNPLFCQALKLAGFQIV